MLAVRPSGTNQLQRLRALLLRYVNSRERAYLAKGVKSLRQLAPISRIKKQLDCYQRRSLYQHYHLVGSLESDLRAILPKEESRFEKQRLQVLATIDYCKKKTSF
jgi:hypothetical protein